MGYEDTIIKIVVLFFADDGLLMAKSIKEAMEMIKVLINVARKRGLELNKKKSKILMFNSSSKHGEIEGIDVVDKIKYLGVTITNKRDCFGEYRKGTITNAIRLANLSYSIMARS